MLKRGTELEIVVAIQGGHKVRSSFVENGIFLINAILLYRCINCILFIVKLCIKNVI